MKKLFTPLIGIAAAFITLFFLSNILPPLMNFFAWFFVTKEEMNTQLTTGQAIAIDIATYAIAYASVGSIFNFLRWFDKDAMHIAYVVISTAVALGLTLLLRFFLDYYWIILIVLGAMAAVGITLFVLHQVKEKQKEAATND